MPADDSQPSLAGTATGPRLLLIDPKPLTRSYLAARIRAALTGSLAEVGNVQDVPRLYESGARFDAMILNLGDEAFNAETLGTTLVPVRSRLPDCAVLLLTSRTDTKDMVAALWQGVQAYLTTDRRLEETIDAIRFVCAGWFVYPSAGLRNFRSMLSGPRTVADEGFDPDELTPRQAEVLHCLVTGMSNRGIASHLHISPSTVKAHVKGIMLRFGAANRTQAVALLRAERRRSAGNSDGRTPTRRRSKSGTASA